MSVRTARIGLSHDEAGNAARTANALSVVARVCAGTAIGPLAKWGAVARYGRTPTDQPINA